MKRILISLILLASLGFWGCAGIQQAEQTKAQFHTYSTTTPVAADKLLFSDESAGHAIHTVLASDLPIYGDNVKMVQDSETIQDVLNAIIDATKTNPYLVIVPPGVRTVTATVAIPDYVNVEFQGTIIKPATDIDVISIGSSCHVSGGIVDVRDLATFTQTALLFNSEHPITPWDKSFVNNFILYGGYVSTGGVGSALGGIGIELAGNPTWQYGLMIENIKISGFDYGIRSTNDTQGWCNAIFFNNIAIASCGVNFICLLHNGGMHFNNIDIDLRPNLTSHAISLTDVDMSSFDNVVVYDKEHLNGTTVKLIDIDADSFTNNINFVSMFFVTMDDLSYYYNDAGLRNSITIGDVTLNNRCTKLRLTPPRQSTTGYTQDGFLERFQKDGDYDLGDNYYIALSNGGYHIVDGLETDWTVSNHYVDLQAILLNVSHGVSFLFGDATTSPEDVTGVLTHKFKFNDGDPTWEMYDGNSHYMSFAVPDLSANRIFTFPSGAMTANYLLGVNAANDGLEYKSSIDVTYSGFTILRAIYSDASGNLEPSDVTKTELELLDGALNVQFSSMAVADLSDATTPSVLVAAETIDTCISNYKLTGADHVFTMPAAHSAGSVIFQIGDEFQVDIEPNTGDLFYLNGTAMAVNEHIQNTADTLAERIVGYCVNINGTLRWMFYSSDAAWVEETPA